ncbi:MAG TPA: hypothetical protein VMT16_10560 [Thermoanaerobaculia bacterium]|nr:hypothetical protein [Thermoanaerobaculia bacterium]
MKGRSPWLAAGLSALAPGAGQLYNGDRPRGWALLAIAAGVVAAVALCLWGPRPFRSWLGALLLAALYPLLWMPAVADAWRDARGRGRGLVAADSIGYTVLMLLVAGPMALPLLWQNRQVPRAAKRWLTVGVVMVAIGGVLLLALAAPWLEALLEEMGLEAGWP